MWERNYDQRYADGEALIREIVRLLVVKPNLVQTRAELEDDALQLYVGVDPDDLGF